MLKLIAGGLSHTYLLLTLQHPGTGLPEKRNPVFWTLLVAGLCANTALRLYLGTEADFALAMATVAFGLVSFFLKPAIAAAYFLMSIAMDLIHIGILAVFWEDLPEFIRLVAVDVALTTWLVTSVFKLVLKRKGRKV